MENAASSDNPSAPGCVASGEEPCDQAIFGRIPVSAATVLPSRAAEFGGAHLCKLVEHGIDHTGFIALDKQRRHRHIGHHHARWHIGAVDQLKAPARSAARKTVSMRGRQPFDRASSISGSSSRCSRTTPETMSEKCRSAGRYCAPSASRPSNGFQIHRGFHSGRCRQIHQSACTAASRAAPRLFALRASLSSRRAGAHQRRPACAWRDHGEAALAASPPLSPSSARTGTRYFIVDGEYAVTDGRRSFTKISISRHSFDTSSKW